MYISTNNRHPFGKLRIIIHDGSFRGYSAVLVDYKPGYIKLYTEGPKMQQAFQKALQIGNEIIVKKGNSKIAGRIKSYKIHDNYYTIWFEQTPIVSSKVVLVTPRPRQTIGYLKIYAYPQDHPPRSTLAMTLLDVFKDHDKITLFSTSHTKTLQTLRRLLEKAVYIKLSVLFDDELFEATGHLCDFTVDPDIKSIILKLGGRPDGVEDGLEGVCESSEVCL